METFQQRIQGQQDLGHFLVNVGLEPSNNGAGRALRKDTVKRRINHDVPYFWEPSGPPCTVDKHHVRQKSRDELAFLEQAKLTHRNGGVMPCLLLND
jgi:hypothetical protein